MPMKGVRGAYYPNLLLSESRRLVRDGEGAGGILSAGPNAGSVALEGAGNCRKGGRVRPL
ncbi:MAG: hypothetical protein E3J37_08290 [Anaerolineales bacterium]|nr:MAG: hypothetical protein E3J37_08290 [Anaerolineales bacterium]